MRVLLLEGSPILARPLFRLLFGGGIGFDGDLVFEGHISAYRRRTDADIVHEQRLGLVGII